MQAIVDELKQSFDSGKTRDVAWRRDQLTKIQLMIEENHEAVAEAVAKDFRGPKIRAIFELGCHQQAQIALDNLDSWTRDEKIPHPEMFGHSYIRPTPRGVAIIIGPFNYPIHCVMSPLVSCIAAGNCCVIKPSEMPVNCAQLLENLINKYLDTTCIRVVQGAIPETTELMACTGLTHYFYTGSTNVGRIVMKAAVKNLAKVTLELGGKSPVFVDETAKIECAVKRILLGKTLNVGQTCVAPDFILVHQSKKEEFVKIMKMELDKMYNSDAAGHGDYGRIICDRHVNRIKDILKGTNGKIVSSFGTDVDPKDCYVPPVLLEVDDAEDSCYQQEIFGPVLPIKTFNTLDEAIALSRKICFEPLALYVFSESSKNIEYVLNKTESGGVCINSVMEHLGNPNLPFGGKGESGQGAYQGKHGFDEFSHKRAVFVKTTFPLPGLQEPVIPLAPYPTWLYDIALKLQVTGFIPKPLRFQKKYLVAMALLVAYLKFIQ